MPKSRQGSDSVELYEVKIDKLVHGGQGLGTLPDGRKVFVWNSLPGELVNVRIIKGKRDYAEGIAEEIITASPERVDVQDESYLSTSPWQIMTFKAENKYKHAILCEAFAREKLSTPTIDFISSGKAGLVRFSESEIISEGPMEYPPSAFHYRNKMEYSFWADDDGLHLALFNRGSHGKRIVIGSSIARPEIDQAANKICAILNKHGIRGSKLKTVMVRCSQAGNTVAALFVKDQDFPVLNELEQVCQGIEVCFSNPKSPASIVTKELYAFGEDMLADKIMGHTLTYDVHSFFQVNVPVFEAAASQIDFFTKGFTPKVDFYCGVGTIGIPVKATVLVDSDPHNTAMARKNVAGQEIEVVEATAENALDYIPTSGALIVDPPRAGLHAKVIEKIREARPAIIAYLSCNPSTQARDIKLLEDTYKIKSLEGYNFFPCTPHIESLAILNLI